jgi:G3E family GTPase
MTPVTLITGFLGTGKTTAIRSLLDQRPAHERWGVFINEYGIVSLDEALLDLPEDSPVSVQELAGGCFCCETAELFKPMLVQFLRRVRPHRLLIEPSGAGHPASVLDLLRESRFFSSQLTLQAVICLVDPQDTENPRIRSNPVFHDQLEMADIVVINHTDHRSAESIAHCRTLIEQLDPPKLLIAETAHGQLQQHWLTMSGSVIRRPRFPDAHTVKPVIGEPVSAPALVQLGTVPTAEPDLQTIPARPEPGRPLQFPGSGSGWYACGWLFAPEDRFRREPLWELLESWPGIQRLKGVFHCEDDWWSINRAGREASFRRSCWRRDSRLEIITERPLNWDQVAEQLRDCSISCGG